MRPLGLETKVTKEQTEEMKSEEQMADEDDKESTRSLEQQSTDVRHPQLERVRSPKRTNEDELSDDDTREHKGQTIALTSEFQKFTIGAIFATTWRIIPFSKWLITMVSKSPKQGCSPYKWPKWLINGGY